MKLLILLTVVGFFLVNESFGRHGEGEGGRGRGPPPGRPGFGFGPRPPLFSITSKLNVKL